MRLVLLFIRAEQCRHDDELMAFISIEFNLYLQLQATLVTSIQQKNYDRNQVNIGEFEALVSLAIFRNNP